jgi:hypothetical protein
MAKRKKRANVQPKKRAEPRRRHAAVRGKARKVSKSARGKGTKPTAGAKPQRAAMKRAVRKKERHMKPPGPGVETVVVDVIEEPAPGVITVTEIEETQIPAGRDADKEAALTLQTFKLLKADPGCGGLRPPVCLGSARAPFSPLWLPSPCSRKRRASALVAPTYRHNRPRLFGIPSSLHDERIVSRIEFFTHAKLDGDGRIRFQTRPFDNRLGRTGPAARWVGGNGCKKFTYPVGAEEGEPSP